MLPFVYRLCFDYPKRTILLALVFTAALVSGFGKLTFSNDFRIYFSEQNPQLQAFERYEQEFSDQQNLYLGVVSRQGSIFTREILHAIEQLSTAAAEIPYASKVYSFNNYQDIQAADDTLTINNYYQDARQLSDAQLTALRQRALVDDGIINYHLSPDEQLSGINVTLLLPEDNLQATPVIMDAARKLAVDFEARYPQIRIIIGGSVASNDALAEGIKRDMQTLVVASYLLIVIGLWFFLKRFKAMVATLVVVSLSVLSTFGLFAHLGYVLTPISGFVPSIVLTIAVADSVHILVSYRFAMSQGLDKSAALKEALRINWQPVFITSLTTIIGVLCLNFSDSPPYRDLGNMVAVGVLFAWLYSLTVLPSLVNCIGLSHPANGKSFVLNLDKMAAFIKTHRLTLIVTHLVLIAGALFYITQNRITEDWVAYFDDSFAVSQTVKTIQKHTNAIHRLEYVLATEKDHGIYDPTYLKQVENFLAWLNEQEEVTHTVSIIYPLKRMHKAMHNDQQAYFALPDDRELIAQYLFLYELSANSQGMSHLLNLAHESTRVSVLLKRTESDHILAFEERANQWLRDNGSAIARFDASSLDLMFAHIAERNILSLLIGTGVALLVISLLLILALRSVKLGLISMVPNMVPAILAYGVWGLFVGQIDMALAIVICMSLGIVVDDTVHFLSKYQRAKREKQLSTYAAIDFAFRSVGTALLTTSAVLILGFLVLIFSGMTPTKETGTLLAITLFFAIIVDFFLLPPLLLTLDKTKAKT